VRTPTRPPLRRSWSDGSWPAARASCARACSTAAPRSLRVSSGTCAPLLPRRHEAASRPPAGPIRGARRAVRSEIKTVPCIRIRRGLPYLAVVASDPPNRSDDPIAVVSATRLVSPQGTFRHARRGGSGRPTKLSAVRGPLPLPPDARPLGGRPGGGRRRGGLQVACEAPWREPTRQADLTEGPVPEWLSR
jgi:hypothetical protein